MIFVLISSLLFHTIEEHTHTLWLLLSAVSPSLRPSLSLLHPCSLSVNFTHVVKLPEVKMVVWVPQGWNDWQSCSWRTAELAASNTIFHTICWQLSRFCGCCSSTHPVLLLLLLVHWVLIWQYQLCSTDKYIENWWMMIRNMADRGFESMTKKICLMSVSFQFGWRMEQIRQVLKQTVLSKYCIFYKAPEILLSMPAEAFITEIYINSWWTLCWKWRVPIHKHSCLF